MIGMNMIYTTKQIAEKCGKSIRSVCSWADKNNVKRDGRTWVFTDEDCAAILDYYNISTPNEANEANEASNEPFEASFEANEATREPFEANEAQSFEVNEAFEASREANEVDAISNDALSQIIASYEKQLAAKDETINRLLDDLRESNAAVHKLSAGYAVEKTADSVERMNAIVPREEKKMGFAARLKFLFTGQQ